MFNGDSRPVALRQASEFLASAAHPIRLQILAALRDEERRVGELVDQAMLPQAVVSRHLGILRRAHLVRCERHGRERVYGIADGRARALLNLLFSENPTCDS